MPKKTIYIIGCFFVFGGFFLTLRYINLIQEKKKIESQLKEVKIQVGFLEGNLRQETELRQKLDEEKSDALLGKNIELESRLNSVSELKKAIAELKLKLKLKTNKSGYNYKLKP